MSEADVTGGTGTDDTSGLLDADRVLAFTGRLRDARDRIEATSPDRRSNYQRRLAAIADAGQDDMEKAESQLERLEAELDRHL